MSEHDALCCLVLNRALWLAEELTNHRAGISSQISTTIEFPIGHEAALEPVGFVDCLIRVDFADEGWLPVLIVVECKTTRESFSGGDVLRQIKRYEKGIRRLIAPVYAIYRVLVTNKPDLDPETMALLKNEDVTILFEDELDAGAWPAGRFHPHGRHWSEISGAQTEQGKQHDE